MVDRETISVYDTKAADYAKLLNNQAPDPQLVAFMRLLPDGGRVLDLGCGPATSSAHLRDAYFRPDPIDASAGMVMLANETYDINARVMTFDEVNMVGEYAGVWANFSLLHAPRTDLPRHLDAVATALVPQGVLSIGMKTGTAETRDGIGRMYTYVTIPELSGLLNDAGFSILAVDEGEGVGLAGSVDPWVVIRARKD
ncbi:SAM-dependent methyltransferase [Loktanella ponticola]|uniref:SAM-dependent methyltransferase n=1 Tax=Yoonia ponticola TaxID=1524255 RepID=A0A7W9EWG3_9RHOB|nr:class I SAM-dependent methyltransferase [Yoonia ponticola]MBB5720667.1 SAM-dependent methyltransferase [Yoonia ponticola]